MSSTPEKLIWPEDSHNLELLNQIRPSSYTNPTPQGRYNLVVIGAGTAGLVTAIGAANVGAHVALVEKHLIGGDCLNVGCVPSKSLLRAARTCHEVRHAADFGTRITGTIDTDFPAIMERMRRVRTQLVARHSVSKLRELGIDVFIGKGSFTDTSHLNVNGQTLDFAKAVICTGTRPVIPEIPGLAGMEVLTNETIFSLTDLPKRLAVIGSGPLGSEMAQAFVRFGSQVTVFDISPDFMPKEDSDAAEIVKKALEREGVRFYLGCSDLRFERNGNDKTIHAKIVTHTIRENFDQILVATGRHPNVENLNLEAAKVIYDEIGILVNDQLRTTNHRVLAAGDVCSNFKYTHSADAFARIVISNALFFGSHRVSALKVPWCTYTDPEIAHVGIYPGDPQAAQFKSLTLDFSELDRAIIDGEENGMLKLQYDHHGLIQGGTIVAPHASEIIGQVVLAMIHRIKMSQLSGIIYPYPTQSSMIHKAGDAYRRKLMTPFVLNILKKILDWRR